MPSRSRRAFGLVTWHRSARSSRFQADARYVIAASGVSKCGDTPPGQSGSAIGCGTKSSSLCHMRCTLRGIHVGKSSKPKLGAWAAVTMVSVGACWATTCWATGCWATCSPHADRDSTTATTAAARILMPPARANGRAGCPGMSEVFLQADLGVLELLDSAGAADEVHLRRVLAVEREQ